MTPRRGDSPGDVLAIALHYAAPSLAQIASTPSSCTDTASPGASTHGCCPEEGSLLFTPWPKASGVTKPGDSPVAWVPPGKLALMAAGGGQGGGSLCPRVMLPPLPRLQENRSCQEGLARGEA